MAGYLARLASRQRRRRVRWSRQRHQFRKLQADGDTGRRGAHRGRFQRPVRAAGRPDHEQLHPLQQGIWNQRHLAQRGFRARSREHEHLQRECRLQPDVE